jgi:hypothetical protein
MAVTVTIEAGTLPSYDLTEDGDTGIYINSSTMSFKRTYETKRNANKQTIFHRGVDPVVELSYQCHITGSSRSGFASQHPGTTVTALTNYATTIRGFNPTEGTMILMDVEDTLQDTDETPTTSFTVMHYPGV